MGRNANQELSAWLDRHGYDHADAKKRGRSYASATIRHDGPRTFKLIERHLPNEVGGRIDLTIVETLTPVDGGLVVDVHTKGTQEGRRVDDRDRKFYPDVSMEKAVAYRLRMGYSEITGGAHARIIHQEPTGRPVFAEHERDHHITTSGRRALKATQFALPPGPGEKRRGIKGRLPIDTIERARNALTRASQMQKRGDITARQLTAIRHRVNRAFPAIHVSPIED
jgi:hypothetical protein